MPAPTATPSTEELYSTPSSADIEDAFVDVTEDRVLVRYELPAGYDLEATNYLVLGAAAESRVHSSSEDSLGLLCAGEASDRLAE